MNLKKALITLSLIVALMGTTSCGSLPFFKKKDGGFKQATEQVGKVTNAEGIVAKNNEKVISAIGVYAEGTDHALGKVNTEDLPAIDGAAVQVATEMNERTKSLAGEPNIDDKKEVHAVVNQLVADLVQERVTGEELKKANAELAARSFEGTKKLNELDEKYIELQKQAAADRESLIKQVESLKSTVITQGQTIDTANNSLEQSKAVVKELEDKLGKFNSQWGFYAIKHGIMIFLRNAAWFLTGFGILFLILRIGAASNPIIGAIFSVFEHMAAAAGKIIASLLPRVFEMAGHVKAEISNLRGDALKKIVDEIQSAGTQATVNDLKDALSKAMDIKEKRLIDEIKRDLGYK
jgi:hypothetical protein